MPYMFTLRLVQPTVLFVYVEVRKIGAGFGVSAQDYSLDDMKKEIHICLIKQTFISITY